MSKEKPDRKMLKVRYSDWKFLKKVKDLIGADTFLGAFSHVCDVYREQMKSPLDMTQNKILNTQKFMESEDQRFLLSQLCRAITLKRKGHDVEDLLKSDLDELEKMDQMEVENE